MANIVEQGIATRFKRGESGNPNGRPKGKSAKTILKKIVESGGFNLEEHGQYNLSFMELICYRLAQKAADGDIRAIKEIFDRIDGKPMPILPEISEPEPTKVTINFIDLDKSKCEKLNNSYK